MQIHTEYPQICYCSVHLAIQRAGQGAICTIDYINVYIMFKSLAKYLQYKPQGVV
uniref:Uncharacterized protein n=1 Tax=Anguilla anguilla TaxID=7936 RepID=A0A0E9WXH1_ANGAN